jgi:hypothetical protein
LATILSSRPETAETPKFGISINNHTPLEASPTTDHLISRALEEPDNCRLGTPTQDGGKSSYSKVSTSATSKIKEFLILKEERIKKVKTLLSTRDIMVLTRDGRLSILTNPRMSQLRDSTKSSVCTSADHSILYPDSQ